MSRIAFFVVGDPVAQGSLKSFRHRSSGAIVTPQDKRVVSWRELVAQAALLVRRSLGPTWQTIAEPVGCALLFLVARPPSHLNAKGLLKPKAARVPLYPDGDKLVRAVWDGLAGSKRGTGVLLADDGYFAPLMADKVYSRATTGVAIAIAPRAAAPTLADCRTVVRGHGMTFVGDEVVWSSQVPPTPEPIRPDPTLPGIRWAPP